MGHPKANTSYEQPGTIFEVFSCPRDILGELKIQNWLCDMMMPLSRTVCHLSSKFEVSMITHYEHMKGNVKCVNWSGFWRLEVTQVIGNITFNRAHTITHSTLLETKHLSCNNSELQSLILTYPTCI